MAASIVPVEHPRQWKQFYELPWKIYGGDPAWVPPLLMDVKEMFHHEKNPFFEHGEIQPFLAVEGGEAVGRIVAVANRAHDEAHRDRAGFFGFFECQNRPEVAQALVARAGEWCRAKGYALLRGPANFSSNDEWGMLVDGFEYSPFILMTHNPKYYPNLMEACGLHKAKDLYAFYLSYAEVPELPERVRRITEWIRKREGVTIRPLNMKDFRAELARFKDVYNHAWADNWGFVPMTERELDYMAKKLKPLILPDTVLFAEIGGQVAGVAFALPDYNQVLKGFNGRLGPWKIFKLLTSKKKIKTSRGLVVGVKAEYRKKGIAALLNAEWYGVGKRLGYTGGELSWILEDNVLIIREIEAMGCRRYKTYRVYERAI